MDFTEFYNDSIHTSKLAFESIATFKSHNASEM